jgi:cytochrome c6
VLAVALATAGCGAVGRVTTGDPGHGKLLFVTPAKPGDPSCGSCHTLADAKTTGTVGPNLDSLKPDYQAVTAQVTNGSTNMPSFNHTLSTQQIADVAAYVVTATGGTAP